MYGLQECELLHFKKQEKGGKETGVQEVLQILQEINSAQRSQNDGITINRPQPVY
jgi:hypothetical protein